MQDHRTVVQLDCHVEHLRTHHERVVHNVTPRFGRGPAGE
jgi:hypothetical protein